jgi:hypothetical protein
MTIESEDGTRLVLHDQRKPDHDPHVSWRRHIRSAVQRAIPLSAPALTINATQLARWGAAVATGERLSIFTGAKGDEMILVLVEDHFAGLWQPQNLIEGADLMLEDSPWTDELGSLVDLQTAAGVLYG